MSHTRINERMGFLIGEWKIAREEKNDWNMPREREWE